MGKLLTCGFMLTCLLTACSVSQKSNKKDTETVWVNSYTIRCEADKPPEGLLIQFGDTLNRKWQRLCSPIEGFVFKPGYIYTLKVKKGPAIPVDGGQAFNLKFIKELHRSWDSVILINDIWMLESVNKQLIALSNENNRPRVEFHLSEHKFYGKGTCNPIMGTIVQIGGDDIRLSITRVTPKICQDRDLEELFIHTLSQSAYYFIENKLLRLFDSDRKEILSFRKTD